MEGAHGTRRHMKKILATAIFALSVLAHAQYGPPQLSFPNGPTLPGSCNGATVFSTIISNVTTPYYCSGGSYTAFGTGTGTGTVTSVTFTGDGIVDSSTP